MWLSAAEPVGGVVAPGQHREHAGRRRGARDIDRDEPRMRMGRAHEHGISLARPVEIVDEAPAPGEEPLVLDARHALSDELGHAL